MSYVEECVFVSYFFKHLLPRGQFTPIKYTLLRQRQFRMFLERMCKGWLQPRLQFLPRMPHMTARIGEAVSMQRSRLTMNINLENNQPSIWLSV